MNFTQIIRIESYFRSQCLWPKEQLKVKVQLRLFMEKFWKRFSDHDSVVGYRYEIDSSLTSLNKHVEPIDR